jgi:lincosamide nucleotidyltransferase A/C/D/E
MRRTETVTTRCQNVAVTASRSDQIRVMHEVLRTLDGARIRAWLFGGWGLDARLGRITRDHGDIELWVERSDAHRSRDVLVKEGATLLNTQPEEEACEFLWADVPFSTAYFDRRAEGSFAIRGRWSDWVFPAGSFEDSPGRLDGVSVPVMSTSGMIAMKEQYPQLRNGGPWRSKDIQDLVVLREMLAEDEWDSHSEPSQSAGLGVCPATPGNSPRPPTVAAR